ncbi:hypothetical protein [Treponema pectinovorum]|uniref:hypothetical protein n=1 Tax=Treponema pectinovorum TaxID=164 RepID=UPI0011F11B2B|nr:hypothetical protein [Treponema pectinovorum]
MAVGEFEKENFLSTYILERGLLNVSKSEYGKIVFYELAFIKNVCGFFGEFSTFSISSAQLYSIAEKLKIKPSKVASLLKDIFYSGFEKTENNSSFPIEIICKYISKDRFEKEELAVFIANPVEQEIVERFLLENNARYDTSFNRKIIKIPFTVIDAIFSAEAKNRILQKMKEVSDSKIDIKFESINEKGKFVEIAKNTQFA